MRLAFLSLLLSLAGVFSAAPAAPGEPLAVIVNKSNPADNMSLSDLRKYAIQEWKHWPNNTRVTVVLRDPGQLERQAVLEQVYHFTEADFKRYFLQAEFTGEVQVAPKHLATATGVCRFIFNVPGAIGFVRASDVDPTVKTLRVDGFAPGDPKYPLQLSNP